MKKAGFIYNPKVDTAEALARELAEVSQSLATVWVRSSWAEEEARELAPGTDLLVSVGGDGTILRAARIASPWGVPILGVNMGKLGFLTEVTPGEALQKMPAFISGEGWIEERAMLQAQTARPGRPESTPLHVLNDVVVARGPSCRVIQVRASVDGELVGTYKADGVIVATATGSTGYALAAGGPILHPLAGEMVLKAVAPHLTLNAALVLPSAAAVELELQTDLQAVLSLDGQVEAPLAGGDLVRVRRSHHVARFLRDRPPAYFYGCLQQALSRSNSGK